MPTHMPLQGDNIMIQSPYQHQSPHGNSPVSRGGAGLQSSSSSSRHPRASPAGSSSYGGGNGRGSKEGNSPNHNSPPIYGHPGNAHYISHAPVPMQSPPPYTIPSQNNGSGNGNGMTPSHHPSMPPHHHSAYPMHPMYGQYPPPASAGYPYHPHMPPHGYPQHHRPYTNNGNIGGASSSLSSSKNADTPSKTEPDGMMSDDKAPMATAVSRKTNKGDPFGPTTPSSAASSSSKPADAVLNVEHMKHDFHFYVQDVKKKVTDEATCYLRTCTPSPLDVEDEELRRIEHDKDDAVHPYLLFTNINERLIAGWEKMPQSKRSEYLVKEEEDRRRFQSAEEVASQHCATLTARARSPQAFSTRNRDVIAASVKVKKDKDDYDAETLSPAPTSSLTRILQSEGDNHNINDANNGNGNILSQRRTNDEVGGSSPEESPTKKNRVDPLARITEIYGDEYFYRPERHDELSSDKLRNLAARVPSSENGEDMEILEAERQKFLSAAERSEAKRSEDEQLRKDRVEDDDDDDGVDDDQEAMEVGALLDRRVRQVRGKKIREYLVQWKGLGEDANSWEPLRNVEHCEEMIKAIDNKKRQEKEKAVADANKKAINPATVAVKEEK